MTQDMTKSKKNIIKNFEKPDNEREYLLSKIKLHGVIVIECLSIFARQVVRLNG